MKIVTPEQGRPTTLRRFGRLGVGGVLVAGLLQMEAVAQAGQPEIADRLSALEAVVQKLVADITQLTELLRTSLPPPPPGPIEEVPPLILTVGDAAALGSPAAQVAIVEYSDFQCPFCGRHAGTCFPSSGES